MGKYFIAIITAGLIFTGAMNTIAFKVQNSQIVYDGAFVKYFFHPYIQTSTMFLGEALMLPIFLIMRAFNE